MHYFVRRDGRLVFGGNFIAVFYEYDWMLRFHVLQESPSTIRVFFQRVPEASVPSGDLADLTSAIQAAMGEATDVLWEETAHVPISPVGKHLHARSLVWEQRNGISADAHQPGV